MDSLCNRKGFDDWWFNLDDETQEEIEGDILMIIELRLNEIIKLNQINDVNK